MKMDNDFWDGMILGSLISEKDERQSNEGCFKEAGQGCVIFFVIMVGIIVLFFTAISILGHFGNNSGYEYEFMKYMKK